MQPPHMPQMKLYFHKVKFFIVKRPVSAILSLNQTRQRT